MESFGNINATIGRDSAKPKWERLRKDKAIKFRAQVKQ